MVVLFYFFNMFGSKESSYYAKQCRQVVLLPRGGDFIGEFKVRVSNGKNEYIQTLAEWSVDKA